MEEVKNKVIDEFANKDYEFGFTSDIEMELAPKGLNEDTIKYISDKKGEPQWMLDYRLKAYRHWLTMKMPKWGHLDIPKIDYQDLSYYAAPKNMPKYESLDEVNPELIETFNKLGIPLEEQKRLTGIAVDAVFDSVSVKTTFQETLKELDIIFCSMSDAIKEHPDLVKKYLGSVVPYTDNYFAALNAAVFSDGSFCYIPKGAK